MTDDDLYSDTEYNSDYEVVPGYVPTLYAVRASYATDYWMTTVSTNETGPTERAAAFDRLIKGIRAEVWQEGYDAGGGYVDEAHNPYKH